MEEAVMKEKRSYGVPLFLSGAAMGAVLGVMFAPDSGKETRRKLADWIKEKRAKGREQVLQKKDQVAAAIEAGAKAFKEAEKKKLGV